MEYRYWLEFADSAVVQPVADYVPVFAYRASQDAEFESGNESTPIVVGSAAEEVIEMRGDWQVDVESFDEDAAKSITGGNFLITRSGEVHNIKSNMQLKTWFWRHEANTDTPIQPKGSNVYDLRHKGKSTTITFHSATSATIVYKEKIAIPLVRKAEGSAPNQPADAKSVVSGEPTVAKTVNVAG